MRLYLDQNRSVFFFNLSGIQPIVYFLYSVFNQIKRDRVTGYDVATHHVKDLGKRDADVDVDRM